MITVWKSSQQCLFSVELFVGIIYGCNALICGFKQNETVQVGKLLNRNFMYLNRTFHVLVYADDKGFSFERNCIIHSDEGLRLENSVFESFTPGG